MNKKQKREVRDLLKKQEALLEQKESLTYQLSEVDTRIDIVEEALKKIMGE